MNRRTGLSRLEVFYHKKPRHDLDISHLSYPSFLNSFTDPSVLMA